MQTPRYAAKMLMTVILLGHTACAMTADPPVENERLTVGADISWADQEEYWGVDFYDNGREQPLLEILADHGFDAVRLRLFVDPLAEGEYQGYNRYYDHPVEFAGLQRTIAFARKVHQAGFALLLDFHYSDTWADPANQHKPHDWMQLSLPELKDQLYDYTAASLQAFSDAGAAPDMVQIGNEIGGGFLWDSDPAISGSSRNWEQFTSLLQQASRAVRDTLPEAEIMVHHENSGSADWFEALAAAGVDFDLIGVSHYPQFGGTVAGLRANLHEMEQLLEQDIYIVEYSAQAEEVYAVLHSLPPGRARGAFIWEPINWNDPEAENLFEWRDGEQRGHHTNERIDRYPGIAEP